MNQKTTTENTDKTYVSLKSELQLIKALNTLYKERIPEERLNINEMEDYKGYISDCNIFMFIPKTARMKEIFNRFTDKNFKQMQNIPDLKYNVKYSTDDFISSLTNTARYNTKLLIKLLKCFDSVYETLDISLCRDYPLKLECEHFIFILAPRIEPY